MIHVFKWSLPIAYVSLLFLVDLVLIPFPPIDVVPFPNDFYTTAPSANVYISIVYALHFFLCIVFLLKLVTYHPLCPVHLMITINC